jgi:hypothetical protein
VTSGKKIYTVKSKRSYEEESSEVKSPIAFISRSN